MDEKTFKVGDRVKTLGGVEGVISYGPVIRLFGTEPMYAVTSEGLCERLYEADDLGSLPAFKVGDRITYYHTRATIEGGPYADGDGTTWVARTEEGTLVFPDERFVSPAPADEHSAVKVGDKVRVVVDDPMYRTGEFVGRVGVVAELGTATYNIKVQFGDASGSHGDPDHGTWWCKEVERVDDATVFIHEGIAYEYGAVYRDCEGDLFEFRPKLSGDGTQTPEGRARYGADYEDEGAWHWSLGEVVCDYGPLTKQ